MLTSDTLSPAAHVLLSMSEQEYLLLLLKLLGMAAGLLTGAIGFMVGLYKAGQLTWRLMLASLRADLSASFCTPAQLATAIADAMKEVTERLNEGDARMSRTDEEIRLTRQAVEQGNRRFTRILALLVAQDGAARANPTLRAAMDSDSDLPIFDLPHGDSSCAA